MYYPKSQITTDLYTNGNEYVYTSNKQEYIGYYWKTSSGKVFTGKTPQDTPIQQLTPIEIPYSEPSNINNSFLESSINALNLYEPDYEEEVRIITYAFLKNIDTNVKILVPIYSPTLPTSQDYQIGEMRRYFCKKINEISYLEINKDTYDKLIGNNPTIAFQYYQAFNVPWQLTGDKEQVFKTNRNIVELTMKQQKLPQFDLYLQKDYTKYYQ